VTVVRFGDVPWEPRSEDEWPCLVKRLVVDDEQDVAVRAVWYARGAVEPRHVHAGSHAAIVLVGSAVVDGRTLGPWDVIYGPGDHPHGPLAYPHGCVLFALISGGAFHTAVGPGALSPPGLGPRLVAECDVPWEGDRKLLLDDPDRGYAFALERRAPDPPAAGVCAALVLTGRAAVEGVELGPWDLVYLRPGEPPPELELGDGCTLAVTGATSTIAATR
jgi:hypothetical protein